MASPNHYCQPDSRGRAIVCVTGGTGFIGRSLVIRLLADGYRVRVLTRGAGKNLPAEVEIFRGDLGQPGCFFEDFLQGADLLFHCAAELKNSGRCQVVNVEGAERLIASARGRLKRWVQLSSVGVYGPHRCGEVREDAAINPANTYECTKAEADLLVAETAANGKLEAVVVRPSTVFGPGMPNRSLFQLAAMIRRRLFFFIGPPGASANYVPVDNVVDALVLCGTHPAAAGKVFNVSDWTTVESFTAAMADALGVPSPRWRLPLAPVRGLARLAEWIPGSPLTVARVDALTGRARYPTDRIETELGFRHRQSLTEALNTLFRGNSLA